MHQEQWATIVAHLNLSWPGQTIATRTADEWYGPTPDGQGTGPLASFPYTEVFAAIDRHRCNITPGRDGLPLGRWLPTLADILYWLDTNWREAAAARRELQAQEARNSHHGQVAIAPPEWDEIRRIIEASKGLPEEPGHMLGQVARQRIQALIDQHNQRVDREQAGELV